MTYKAKCNAFIFLICLDIWSNIGDNTGSDTAHHHNKPAHDHNKPPKDKTPLAGDKLCAGPSSQQATKRHNSRKWRCPSSQQAAKRQNSRKCRCPSSQQAAKRHCPTIGCRTIHGSGPAWSHGCRSAESHGCRSDHQKSSSAES